MSNGFSKKNLGIDPETSDWDGNRRSSDKCGYKATLNINWNTKIGKYVVTSFTDIHNHKLVSPRNHHRMKVNKFFPEAAKNLTATVELHNISVSKMLILFPYKAFNKWDYYSQNANENKERLGRGDAQATLEGFRKKQNEDLIFYFDIELDEDRALNFFESIDVQDEIESYLNHYDESLTRKDASQPNISTSLADSMMSGTIILNPLIIQAKGRAKTDHKKGARWKGVMDEIVMKKKRTCKSYGILGNHDKRTYPLLKTKIVESRDNNGDYVQPLQENHDNHNI
ncbi:hypothetical protein GIB67_014930 [Kingdonia uniflora]|uniref:Protein FAR1-RELATED SEQUENCE n=1 Tax=Kingdonia uniflora TaxID=39325 RepID=A0A7J7MTC3_9MAGN|nr:hypothetical protein GIB67_014930 [Kingdonia uniflora]